MCGGGGEDHVMQSLCGDPWVLGNGLVNCTTSDRSHKSHKSFVSHDFLHTKSKTRIACWNVRTLDSLSDQSSQLHSVIETMQKRSNYILALSETRWSGHKITTIHSTTILHCSSSTHVLGVAIALSPSARSSWEAAGSVFHPVS